MDFEVDVDSDATTGIPPTRSDNVVPCVSRDPITSEGGTLKPERKRVGGGDNPSDKSTAKRISVRKSSDAIASSHDATPATVSPTASSSMYSTALTFKYNSSDRPPFILQVQPVEDSEIASLHPLHMSRILSQISPRDIVEIRKTGRSRIIAEMRNQEAANRLISNEQLTQHKLKAFIPTYRVLRTGIVRDVSQDFSLDRLRESMTSSIKILEIHRLNRRTKTEGEIKYLPSRTLCVKFAGQFLPHHVSICNCRYPVFPFIPKARICFSCFRVGHMSKNCKSQPRCIYCGNNKHPEEEDCSLKSSPPACINCKGAHLPTSHECVIVIRHKMALALASTENIPLAEARRRVNVSSPDPSFFPKDIRYDYQNFPNLPRRQHSPSLSRPIRQSFTNPNRFSVLADLPPNYEGLPRRTFSSITAIPTRSHIRSARQPVSSRSTSGYAPRLEDPRHQYLVCPNGRGLSNAENGAALTTPLNPSLASPPQPHQDSSSIPLSQGTDDFLNTIKRCFDDLIQPFYCALIERFSHLYSDHSLSPDFSRFPNLPLSAPVTVFGDSSGYPPLPSQS